MGVGRREILTPRSDANCGDGKGREWQVSLADAGQRKTPAAGGTGVSWLRDVKLFRISLGISQRRPLRGQWHIEPAELHRVYPPRTEASTNERIRAYLAEIALLRDRIEDLKTLTDEFRVWVRDLTEQRDRAEARAVELDRRLLAYQPPMPALPAPRPRWWRRFASATAGTSINLAKAI